MKTQKKKRSSIFNIFLLNSAKTQESELGKIVETGAVYVIKNVLGSVVVMLYQYES